MGRAGSAPWERWEDEPSVTAGHCWRLLGRLISMTRKTGVDTFDTVRLCTVYIHVYVDIRTLYTH